VCDRWLESFKFFYEDMGARPDGTSIDRINNDGDYAPDNCRWATREEQANNKRSNVIYEHNGERKTLAQWCEVLGLSYSAVEQRILQMGWPVKRAFDTPIRKCIRLNEECIKVIRYLYDKGTTQKRLAEAYGVTESNISHIVSRKTWSNI